MKVVTGNLVCGNYHNKKKLHEHYVQEGKIMGIKKYGPYTPSRRAMSGYDFAEITKSSPEKSLVESLKKNSGRNNQGKITVRHRGGGSRRLYRNIEW